jgi:hypothetical protein
MIALLIACSSDIRRTGMTGRANVPAVEAAAQDKRNKTAARPKLPHDER